MSLASIVGYQYNMKEVLPHYRDTMNIATPENAAKAQPFEYRGDKTIAPRYGREIRLNVRLGNLAADGGDSGAIRHIVKDLHL